MAQRDGAFVLRTVLPESVEIYGDSERRASLVLTPITATDGTGFVIEDSHMGTQFARDLSGFRDELRTVLQQRKNAAFYRSHTRMEVQNRSGFALAVFGRDDLFVKAPRRELPAMCDQRLRSVRQRAEQTLS